MVQRIGWYCLSNLTYRSMCLSTDLETPALRKTKAEKRNVLYLSYLCGRIPLFDSVLVFLSLDDFGRTIRCPCGDSCFGLGSVGGVGRNKGLVLGLEEQCLAVYSSSSCISIRPLTATIMDFFDEVEVEVF